jgi:nucleoside-diphosphate-sugar epimerase
VCLKKVQFGAVRCALLQDAGKGFFSDDRLNFDLSETDSYEGYLAATFGFNGDPMSSYRNEITPVIIGSSGWLSTAAQNYFWSASTPFSEPIVIGSKERICDQFGNTILPLEHAARLLRNVTHSEIVVFHFAYLTQEKVGKDVDGYLSCIDDINGHVASILDQLPVSGFVYASSGAAGIDYSCEPGQSAGKAVYGTKKLADEILFAELCDNYNIDYLAPRIFSLGGNYINKLNGYAISNMILQALKEGEINIHAKTPVWRSYIDVYDLVVILVKRLEKGGQAGLLSGCFDATLDVTAEMQDLALSVCRHFAINHEKIVRQKFFADGIEDRYVGNSDQFIDLARRVDHHWHNLDQIVSVTADYVESKLKEQNNMNASK